MKKLLFLLACLSLLSCAPGKIQEKIQDNRILLNDLWMVVGLNGSNISVDPDTDGIETPSLEINLADLQYSGTDGCNRFTGNIAELGEENIRFDISAGTKRMCPNMKIPDLFNTVLPQASTYKQEGLFLWIFNEEGEEILKLNKAD